MGRSEYLVRCPVQCDKWLTRNVADRSWDKGSCGKGYRETARETGGGQFSGACHFCGHWVRSRSRCRWTDECEEWVRRFRAERTHNLWREKVCSIQENEAPGSQKLAPQENNNQVHVLNKKRTVKCEHKNTRNRWIRSKEMHINGFEMEEPSAAKDGRRQSPDHS